MPAAGQGKRGRLIGSAVEALHAGTFAAAALTAAGAPAVAGDWPARWSLGRDKDLPSRWR